jgi:Predicted membrane protein (DUF2154).
MSYDSRHFSTRDILGLAFILIGTLVFLSYLKIIHENILDVVFSLPSALIFLGLVNLVKTRHRLIGVTLLFFGIVWIIPRINPEVHYDENVIISMILIMFGIFILLKRRIYKGRFKHYRPSEEEIRNWKEMKDHNWHDNPWVRETQDLNENRIDDAAIFGGGKKILHSENFEGGNITAIFGGSEIDLSGCKLAPGENIIDVLAIFGGTTIIVPKDWKIIVNVVPLFGGFSIKGRRDPNIDYDPTKALVIKGTVIFGGGEVKINTYL